MLFLQHNTPKIIFAETFLNDYTTNWTERDVAAQLTISTLGPGLQFAGNPFTFSRHLRYNTTLDVLGAYNFELKLYYRSTTTSAGGVSIGHVNFAANPNRGVWSRCYNISGDGSTGCPEIYQGNNTNNEDLHTQRAISPTSLGAASTDEFIQTFRRELVPTGALYTVTISKSATPETFVQTTWVDTAASTTESYWSSTRVGIAQIGGTNQLRYFTMEVF